MKLNPEFRRYCWLELTPHRLIAAVSLTGVDGKTETLVSDASWQVSKNGSDGWVAAEVAGPLNMMPW